VSAAAASAAGSDAPPALQGATLILLTIAISLATFMEVLDMTIVNVSIPAIAGTLAVSPTEGTWAISSYTLAAAIMQPLTGWFGRRFGEVRTFAISGMLFIAFSTFCGFSTSMTMLIIGRILQGLVSGPMVPMAQALLLRSYPPQRRGIAMAIWGMVVFIAPICGPVIGGWITDNLSWPWLFFINVPVGLFAIGTSWSLLRRHETVRTPVPVDGIGLLLLVVGVGSLQFALDRGNELDWFESGLIRAAAAAAVVALSLLIAWELTDRHPILDLHLFAHRNFSVGLMAMCLGFFCFFGAVVAYPLWLQTTVGYTAVWAGLATAPVGLLGVLLMPVVGANIQRMNLRAVACMGFLILSAVMFWAGSLNAQAGFWNYVAPRLLQGVGLSCFFLPLQQIMFSDVKPNEFAAASGLSSFLRNIAGSMSTALSVWLWTERTDYHSATLATSIQPGGAWLDWVSRFNSLGGADGSVTSPLLMSYTQYQVAHEAQTLAINDVMHVFGVVLLVLAPTIWLARAPKKGQSVAAGH
jgi:DHA2 family multidrug resistance protein